MSPFVLARLHKPSVGSEHPGRGGLGVRFRAARHDASNGSSGVDGDRWDAGTGGQLLADSRHCLTEWLLRGSDLTVGSVQWRARAGQKRTSIAKSHSGHWTVMLGKSRRRLCAYQCLPAASVGRRRAAGVQRADVLISTTVNSLRRPP